MLVRILNRRFARLLVTSVSLFSFSGTAAALAVATPNIQVQVPENVTQQIQNRVDDYKQRFSGEIAGDKTDALQNKCEDVQNKISQLSTRLVEIRRRRQTAYSDALDRLHSLDSRLTAQAVPHPDLHAAIQKADADFAQLTAGFDKLQNSLDDARNINCGSDIAGFLSSIAAARSNQLAAQSQLSSLRDDLNGICTTLLPKLKAFVDGGSLGQQNIGMSEPDRQVM